MRTFTFLILAIVFSTGLNAQEKLFDVFPVKDNRITYTSVVQSDRISQDNLYKRAKRWFALTCDEINLEDQNELIGKGHIDMQRHHLMYTIIIHVKAERYKYEITNLKIIDYDVNRKYYALESPQFIIGDKRGYYMKHDVLINNLIKSLKEAMDTPIDTNW